MPFVKISLSFSFIAQSPSAKNIGFAAYKRFLYIFISVPLSFEELTSTLSIRDLITKIPKPWSDGFFKSGEVYSAKSNPLPLSFTTTPIFSLSLMNLMSKLFSRFECTTTLLQASLTATLISSISSKSKPMLFAITEAVSLTIETYSGFAGIDKSMHFCPSLTHSKSIFSLCMPILSPFILIFLYYEYFIKPRNTEQFKNIGPGIDYYKILVFFLKFLQYSNQNAQSATVDVGKLPAVDLYF